MRSFIKVPAQKLKRLARKSAKWPIGYGIIAGILITRWLGLFSSLELLTLDFLLRNRPAEAPDDKIVIVLFNRNSVQNDERVSEQEIADLLETIFSAEPTVVGLNIFLSQSNDSTGRERLIQIFEAHSNLFGIEKVLQPRPINPPKDFPLEVLSQQFMHNDIPVDLDGRIRRTFVGTYLADNNEDPQDNPFKFSFSFKLAETFLKSEGYSLDNHPRKLDIPIFQHADYQGFVEIPFLNASSGGYYREGNISKIQTYLNFRSGDNNFPVIDASELLSGVQSPSILTEKIVIVGRIDSYFPRFIPVAASSSLIQEAEGSQTPILPRFGIVGPELEAHSVSQIVHGVINARPFLYTLPSWLENILIISSGLTGIAISVSLKSSARSAIALVISTLMGFCICFFLIASQGLWLPVTPMAICFPLSGMTYLGFNYRSQRSALRDKQEELVEAKVLESERRNAIERAFSAIHAGPLQRLSRLLRNAKDGDIDQENVIDELEALNKEIRGVGERLRQEAIGDVYFFYSEGDIKLDLTHPMHEVLYEVYSLAVQRKLPGFEKVRVRSVSIEPFNCKQLNLDIKRQLCWFLEESLQNIGKHAIGTTRIQVSGKYIDEFYCLRIEDNGPGILSAHTGDGTQSSFRLEAVLCGKFSRFSKPEGGGTICELLWPSLIK